MARVELVPFPETARVELVPFLKPARVGLVPFPKTARVKLVPFPKTARVGLVPFPKPARVELVLFPETARNGVLSQGVRVTIFFYEQTLALAAMHGNVKEGIESAVDAVVERLIGVDGGSGVGDGFEAGFDFEIEGEGTVAGGVGRVGAEIETAAGGFVGTDALENPPRLAEFTGKFEDEVDLVVAGKWTAVEEDAARRIFLQEETGGVEHDLHYEVVLRGGEFDVGRGEEGGADFIFAEDGPLGATGQFASKRGLAGSGETRHENNHLEGIVAKAGWICEMGEPN